MCLIGNREACAHAEYMSLVLPRAVGLAETFSELPESALIGQEQQLAGRYSGRRRKEFVTARACAHHALGQIALLPCPVLIGSRREPLWPEQVVGSITHCRGYCAAAVAPASELEGMGIDAEPNQRVESGVRALIANPAENRVVDSLLSRYPAIAWDRLAFSAKESVYKLWYPLMRGYLDFLECELEIAVPQAIVCVAGTQIAQGRFYARIKRDVRMNKLTGEWAACAMSGLGYIVTATTLPKGPAATLTKPTAATSTMRED